MGNYEVNELPELDRDKLIAILTDELPVLRAKIGISQDDISSIIGISRQTYSAIETKKRKMSWNTFLSLILFYANNEKTTNLVEVIGAFPPSLRKTLSLNRRMEEEVKAKNCGRQNLKKLLAILLIVNLGSALLIGCGNRKISNDIVSIEQFVGLEVSKPEDEEDIQIVNEFEETIWSELLDNCTVKEYSAEELENLIRDLEQQYSYVIRDDGKTASEAIEEIHGMTVEELAKEQLKKKYAVALIAEEEGLILTDSEYEAELEKQAAANGISSAEYESMFGYEKLYEKFQEERVMEFLKDNLKK